MLTTYFGGCCSFCAGVRSAGFCDGSAPLFFWSAGVRSLFVWCSLRPLVVCSYTEHRETDAPLFAGFVWSAGCLSSFGCLLCWLSLCLDHRDRAAVSLPPLVVCAGLCLQLYAAPLFIALYNVYIRANAAPPLVCWSLCLCWLSSMVFYKLQRHAAPLVSTETEKQREERPPKKFC